MQPRPPEDGAKSPSPPPVSGADSPASGTPLSSLCGPAASAAGITIPERIRDVIAPLLPNGPRQALLSSSTLADAPETLELSLPCSFLASKPGKQALRTILFEATLAALSSLAMKGSLPQGAKESLGSIAALISGRPTTSDLELRTAVSGVFNERQSEIANRIRARSATLDKAKRPQQFISVKKASSVVDSTLMTVAELRALSWVSPETLAHLSFCDQAEKALESLNAGLLSLGQELLAQLNFSQAPEVLAVMRSVLSTVKKGCFDKNPDPSLLPLPNIPKERASNPAAALRTLLKGPGSSASALARFAPSLGAEISASVHTLDSALTLLHEASAWTSTDASPGAELLEQFIDVLPEAAKGLLCLRSDLPQNLPKGLSDFCSIVSRMRLHGHLEGLLAYTVIFEVTPNQECQSLMKTADELPESRERLLENLRREVTSGDAAWIELVSFIASWPHLTPNMRANELAAFHEKACIRVIRGLARIFDVYRENIVGFLKDRALLESFEPGVGLTSLLEDARRLNQACSDLDKQLFASPCKPVLKDLSDHFSDLERALEVLEVATTPADQLQAKVSSLPVDFRSSQLQDETRSLCEFLREKAATVTESRAAAFLECLLESSLRGDAETFASQLDGLFTLIAQTPESSSLRVDHLQKANDFLLGLINDVTAYGQSARAENRPSSGSSSESASLSALTDALRFQLEQFGPLRATIRKHSGLLKPHQLNHIDEQIVRSCQEAPKAAQALLHEVIAQVRTGDRGSSLTLARVFTEFPRALLRVLPKGDGSIEQLRELLRQVP